MAVLSGDGLLSYAFEYIARYTKNVPPEKVGPGTQPLTFGLKSVPFFLWISVALCESFLGREVTTGAFVRRRWTSSLAAASAWGPLASWAAR